MSKKQLTKRFNSKKTVSERKKAQFLKLLSMTGKVKESALAIGYSSTNYLHQLRREDEDFAEAWDDAIHAATDVLEEEAIRRGVEGVKEPVFYKGEVVAYKLVYSDQLLTTLLRANRPDKYNQRGGDSNVNVNFGIAVLPMTSPSEDEWEAKAIAMHGNQEVISLEEKPKETSARPQSVKRGD